MGLFQRELTTSYIRAKWNACNCVAAFAFDAHRHERTMAREGMQRLGYIVHTAWEDMSATMQADIRDALKMVNPLLRKYRHHVQ